MELGRSCIASAYRSFSVINLLWRAITLYAIEHRIGYLFGCCSLHCSTAEQTQPIYSYLRARHYAPEAYRVYPRDSYRMAALDDESEDFDGSPAPRTIPPLLKGYLRAGAVICGPPAFDPEFGVVDVFALQDMERLTNRYLRRYRAESRESLGVNLNWNEL
jgi:putative hemolysin